MCGQVLEGKIFSKTFSAHVVAMAADEEYTSDKTEDEISSLLSVSSQLVASPVFQRFSRECRDRVMEDVAVYSTSTGGSAGDF